MSEKPALPLGKQLLYAVGQLGWSTLLNLIGLQLVYFYLPPENAGIPYFITQATFLLVLNAIVLITASGRLLDAITDPIIASWSDRSTNPRGKRIPFMAMGAVPAAVLCFLMFVPPVRGESTLNIVWLFVMQALFYIAITFYVTPFFALLPELSRNEKDRLNLSMWISVTYALGLIVASQSPALAGVFKGLFKLNDRVLELQMAFGATAVLAAVLMLVPVFTLDERTYSNSQPSTVPLMQALRHTFSNPHFRFYVVADMAYFTSLAIINTGFLYYVTVLLEQPEEMVGVLLPLTVILALAFYPVVTALAQRIGKKRLVVFAFSALSLVFFAVFFLGNGIPFVPKDVQGYVIVIIYAIPGLGFLGVLPNAILADIATHDTLQTGTAQEGMFFAARTLLQKFGQTFGVVLFAILTSFGRDIGNDLGIRLSGVFGFALCALAAFIFLRYREQTVLAEIQQMQQAAKSGKQ